MLVVPVLDLLGSCVVRGVAGRRETYRPIESPLVPGAEPVAVAEALRRAFGLTTLYVADLDAIAGRASHIDSCAALRRRGFTLWLDAGASNGADAAAIVGPLEQGDAVGRTHLVAGLETLAGPEALADALDVAGAERTIFSLDLKQGRPLTNPAASWRSDDPFEIADQAIAFGVRRMIVLDLARVGVGEGVGTESLCRRIAEAYPHVELIAGGGVRSRDDLERLAAAGCDAAIVASALHFGPLTRADVEELRATSEE